MNNKIYKRVLKEANIMKKTNSTIRDIAKQMKISKSTVHKDLQEKLILIDKKLYNEIREILDYHTKIRHINGGNATKIKYLKIRKG